MKRRVIRPTKSLSSARDAELVKDASSQHADQRNTGPTNIGPTNKTSPATSGTAILFIESSE